MQAKPIHITKFNGRYNRGQNDVVPLDHALDESNNRFTHDGVETREGYEVSLTLADILRIHTYRRIGEAERLLVLTTGGNLYDSTASIVSPILTIASMTDFACITMGNRVYITPHDGVSGLASEYVYVYNGSGTARRAAGARVAAAFGGAALIAGGNIDLGQYVMACAYEYESGFISRPQIAANKSIVNVNVASRQVRLTGVPVGGTGVVARHILCSRVVKTVSGDVDGYELFFVPNGTIEDNVTTTIDINFYSSQLVDSADYLEDLLDDIPAGLGIFEYNGRMAVNAESANKALIRMSYTDDYESFSSVDGFINVQPQDSASAVFCCAGYKGNLNIKKGLRSYTTRDNGLEPAEWTVIDLDKGIGTTSPYGVSKILDAQGGNEKYLVASISGLHMFDGGYQPIPLSYKVEDDWNRIKKSAFNKVQVVIDPVGKFIYVNAPLDSATTPSHMFMFDYNNGLDPENVRISLWTLADAPKSIVLVSDFTTKATKFYFSGSSNVFSLKVPEFFNQRVDNATAITSYYRTAYVPRREDGDGVNQYKEIMLRATGSGTLDMTLYSEDDATSATPTGLTLASAPGKEIGRLINFLAGRMSAKFSVDDMFGYYKINRITFEFMKRWVKRPR
jgi:hypothetical protein